LDFLYLVIYVFHKYILILTVNEYTSLTYIN